MRNNVVILVILIVFSATPMVGAQDGLAIDLMGTYETGIYFEGAAEIAAYNPGAARLYVTNGALSSLDILDISDPASPTLVANIDLSPFGGAANSVDTKDDFVVVVIDGEEDGQPGHALFLDLDGELVSQVQVGAVPDMVKITPDGSKVVVANEGEPNADYSIDPEGSISFIDISGGIQDLSEAHVTTAGFENFEDKVTTGVRVFGPDSSFAQDMEPEYIAITPNSALAVVTLQENNAVAGIDLNQGRIVAVRSLGYKDYSIQDNAIDASDKDGSINIQSWPVFGMYQPDGIALYVLDNRLYGITANEGEARHYVIEDESGDETVIFSEEARVEDLELDPEAFPNAEELQDTANLGRLNVTTTLGDTDGDGDYDELYSYGARSFTIWNVDNGQPVYDSGSDFERIAAEHFPEAFNSNGLNDSFDSRSDDKGPEPESVVVGQVGDNWYAFIGLERMGGVMVYDITDPPNTQFVEYVTNTNRTGSFDDDNTGDIGPEGVLFISADNSPTDTALLVVTNEISGSISIFSVQ